MRKPIVRPRAIDDAHPLGMGAEKCDLLVVQIVAVNDQRTMSRRERPQIVERPRSRARKRRRPMPQALQGTRAAARRRAAAVPIPRATRPSAWRREVRESARARRPPPAVRDERCRERGDSGQVSCHCVPLLGTSSARSADCPLHCLCQAVAHKHWPDTLQPIAPPRQRGRRSGRSILGRRLRRRAKRLRLIRLHDVADRGYTAAKTFVRCPGPSGGNSATSVGETP